MGLVFLFTRHNICYIFLWLSTTWRYTTFAITKYLQIQNRAFRSCTNLAVRETRKLTAKINKKLNSQFSLRAIYFLSTNWSIRGVTFPTEHRKSIPRLIKCLTNFLKIAYFYLSSRDSMAFGKRNKTRFRRKYFSQITEH